MPLTNRSRLKPKSKSPGTMPATPSTPSKRLKRKRLTESQRKNLDRRIRQNIGLVWKIARKTGALSYLTPEEIQGHGITVLLNCLRRFKPEKGFQFSTYACKSLELGFIQLIAKAKKTRARFSQLADFATIPDKPARPIRPIPSPLIRKKLMEAFYDTVSPKNAQIVYLRFFGFKGKPAKIKEIADLLGISKQGASSTIRKSIQRVKEKHPELAELLEDFQE